jgi:amidohydrolase
VTISQSSILRAEMMDALAGEVAGACDFRREVHSLPDLSGDESGTRDRTLAALPGGARVTVVADTGAVARYGPPEPAVALRAELDALPILEDTDLPFSSTRPGSMHACGHDVNLAALVGVVRAAVAIGLPIPVAAVLQPREETLESGARDIVESGVLAAVGATSIVSAHLQPTLVAGSVACTAGAVNASADEFVLTVRGMGGHAAYPHLVDDTVVAMAHVIVALQSAVSRRLDPLSPAVLSIGAVSGGLGPNVLPGEVTAHGTLRAMSRADRDHLLRVLVEIGQATARAHGCEIDVRVSTGEPVLVNEAGLTARVAVQLEGMGLSVIEDLRTMGADDFAFFGEHLPSLMMFVGVDGRGGGLHSARFAPGDDAVWSTMQALAAGYLSPVT